MSDPRANEPVGEQPNSLRVSDHEPKPIIINQRLNWTQFCTAPKSKERRDKVVNEWLNFGFECDNFPHDNREIEPPPNGPSGIPLISHMCISDDMIFSSI